MAQMQDTEENVLWKGGNPQGIIFNCNISHCFSIVYEHFYSEPNQPFQCLVIKKIVVKDIIEEKHVEYSEVELLKMKVFIHNGRSWNFMKVQNMKSHVTHSLGEW